jgi:hypothetical protein
MSWAISSGDGDDDWWYEEDELGDNLLEERRREIEKRANLPSCSYNNCLAELISSMVGKKIRFKLFGGAAYVHHECHNESEENNPFSPKIPRKKISIPKKRLLFFFRKKKVFGPYKKSHPKKIRDKKKGARQKK